MGLRRNIESIKPVAFGTWRTPATKEIKQN